MPPAVSVVVVSDYAGTGADPWKDVRQTLAALAAQDLGEPFECLVVESSAEGATAPTDLEPLLPGVRLVTDPGRGSYALKNAGARAATADLVAILDADCTPRPDWLRVGLAALRADPTAIAVSGRTTYAGRGVGERALAVLSRAYLDPGAAGPTQFISNNNAIVRRADYLAHPLPTDGGPFASRIQSEAMRRRGARFRFEPGMVVVHEFEGWAMERDIRRNIGYGTIRIRQLDPKMPWAWMARLGVASIPLFVAARTVDSWWDALRAGRHYGLRWYEQPVVFALAIVVHVLEIAGMRQAFRDEPITTTAYR
jgi:glycosyltransferase involved in cell wall biosynthesis